MNDLISRQETITEFKNYERDSTAPIDYVKIVEQMPPAQPDARYINANELIKRLQQAGLDDAVSIAVKMAGHERLKHVPSAQPDLIAKIQNGINTTNANDSYSCGMRNGMRWCMSLVDGKEPLFENCPSAQPEVVRCKDCKYNGECSIQFAAYADDKFFCGAGERRRDGKIT